MLRQNRQILPGIWRQPASNSQVVLQKTVGMLGLNHSAQQGKRNTPAVCGADWSVSGPQRGTQKSVAGPQSGSRTRPPKGATNRLYSDGGAALSRQASPIAHKINGSCSWLGPATPAASATGQPRRWHGIHTAKERNQSRSDPQDRVPGRDDAGIDNQEYQML